MIPCARLYGFLGCRLAAAMSRAPPHARGAAADNPYAEWLQTYSSPEYLVRALLRALRGWCSPARGVVHGGCAPLPRHSHRRVYCSPAAVLCVTLDGSIKWPQECPMIKERLFDALPKPVSYGEPLL
jgi:hypothetical protein